MFGIRYCPNPKACIHVHVLLARLGDTMYYLTRLAMLLVLVDALYDHRAIHKLTLRLNIMSRPLKLYIAIVQRWLRNISVVLLIV